MKDFEELAEQYLDGGCSAESINDAYIKMCRFGEYKPNSCILTDIVVEYQCDRMDHGLLDLKVSEILDLFNKKVGRKNLDTFII